MSVVEHLAAANRNLRAAQSLLEHGFPENAAGAAYFAMFNVATAALAARGRAARSHPGAWALFSELFVKPGLVADDVYKAAQRARELRTAADYRAQGATVAEARAAIEDAERFRVAVIEAVGL